MRREARCIASFVTSPSWTAAAAAAVRDAQTFLRRKLIFYTGRSKLAVSEYMELPADLHGLMMQKLPGRRLQIL